MYNNSRTVPHNIVLLASSDLNCMLLLLLHFVYPTVTGVRQLLTKLLYDYRMFRCDSYC